MKIPVLVKLNLMFGDGDHYMQGFNVYPDMESWENDLTSIDILPDDNEYEVYYGANAFGYITPSELRSAYKTELIAPSHAGVLQLLFPVLADHNSYGVDGWQSPYSILENYIEDEKERIAEQENAS